MRSRAEKSRRKGLRKAAGLKRYSELFAERQARRDRLEPQPLRRSAVLVSFACFECRKAFKKRFVPEQDHKCPQCANPLAHMGRSFKAPRKTEATQWEKVRRLWISGYRFHTNTRGKSVPAFPQKLRELEAWIADNPRHPSLARVLA
jgi:hypothetical protein